VAAFVLHEKFRARQHAAGHAAIGQQHVHFNVQEYLAPARLSSDPVARDLILRSLDPGRHWGGAETGLGRAAYLADRFAGGPGGDTGDLNRLKEHVPMHLYDVLETHCKKESASADTTALFDKLVNGDPETFPVRRLYEICEEREIVWDKGQADFSRDGHQDTEQKATGFPYVDESVGSVEDLLLRDILKLKHKTNRRRHPKWLEIRWQRQQWHKQYLRRKHILEDEVKARMGVLKLGMMEE